MDNRSEVYFPICQRFAGWGLGLQGPVHPFQHPSSQLCEKTKYFSKNPYHLPHKPWRVIRLGINKSFYKNGIMLGLENTVNSFFLHSDAVLVSSSYLFDVWLKTEVPAMKWMAAQSFPCSYKHSPNPFKILFLSGASRVRHAMCALSRR